MAATYGFASSATVERSRFLLIEYEQILCKLLCEVLYTLIEVSGVTDGLYKHEWNIIIGYLERAMEVLTGVDASGVDSTASP